MTIQELAIQLIGIMGMVALISSFQFKRRRHIIALQLIGSSLFALHFLFLGALTAVAMNVIAVIRNALFARYHDKKRPQWPLISVIVACCIAPIITWDGWISLLPMLALIAGTIGLWQRDEQKFACGHSVRRRFGEHIIYWLGHGLVC